MLVSGVGAGNWVYVSEGYCPQARRVLEQGLLNSGGEELVMFIKKNGWRQREVEEQASSEEVLLRPTI